MALKLTNQLQTTSKIGKTTGAIYSKLTKKGLKDTLVHRYKNENPLKTQLKLTVLTI